MKRERWFCKFLLIAIVFPQLVAAQPAGGPKFSSAGVVNAASFVAGMSPGAFISIFGENLAPVTRSWDGAIQGTALPSQLEGVSVTIGGQPTYLSYISPTQLNVLLPAGDLAGSVQVKVATAQGSASAGAVVDRYAPGLFQLDQKSIVASHGDNVLVAKAGQMPGVTSRPALPGEEIVLWGTGFGPTAQQVPSGQVVTKPYPLANLADLKVSIGGKSASIAFAGVTIAGVCQINAIVPPDVPDGDNTVQAEIGGMRTQDSAFLAVQRPGPLAAIQVSYRLDPWLISNNYGGAVWVSPLTFGPANQGGAAFVIEVRAQGFDANGQLVDISPDWIPSDPAMVTISPNRGSQVKITVQRGGQSSLQVIAQGVSKTLTITSANQGNSMQVQIDQK